MPGTQGLNSQAWSLPEILPAWDFEEYVQGAIPVKDLRACQGSQRAVSGVLQIGGLVPAQVGGGCRILGVSCQLHFEELGIQDSVWPRQGSTLSQEDRGH